jgi:hypothetical protein
MGTLVELTMKEGFIPTVVAYTKDTTVEEAFTTETCSSSSFRYGTFDCAVLSLEGVRQDGQEVMVNLHHNDAIDQLSEIVLITLLELVLIRADKYVELTYWPVDLLSDAWLRITPKKPDSSTHDRSAVDESVDFVDSIMFHETSGIVVTGRVTHAVGHICSRFQDSDTFIQHAKSVRSKHQYPFDTYVETVPLIDYLFRYHVRPGAREKRCSDGRRDSFVTQGCVDTMQGVILPTTSATREAVSSHWRESTLPISMARVEPHSTFGKRRLGLRATLDGVGWHIRAVICEQKEEQPLSALAEFTA